MGPLVGVARYRLQSVLCTHHTPNATLHIKFQLHIKFYTSHSTLLTPHFLRHDGTIVTASEGGHVAFWKYPQKRSFDPIDVEVGEKTSYISLFLI